MDSFARKLREWTPQALLAEWRKDPKEPSALECLSELLDLRRRDVPVEFLIRIVVEAPAESEFDQCRSDALNKAQILDPDGLQRAALHPALTRKLEEVLQSCLND
ncbi:hypothetical protein KW782_00040 [Candidatus Parcubacteria bacterium]|nr:hypothetical protein [Candidatus Parcubacteria bacterium]